MTANIGQFQKGRIKRVDRIHCEGVLGGGCSGRRKSKVEGDVGFQTMISGMSAEFPLEMANSGKREGSKLTRTFCGRCVGEKDTPGVSIKIYIAD
jgi:hypothetical protein